MRLTLIFIFLTIMLSCRAEITPEDKPETVDQLFENYFKEIIKSYPETATRLRLDAKGKYRFDASALSDNSEKRYYQDFKIIKKYRSWADDFSDLPKQDAIELKVFKAYLDEKIELEKYHMNLYVINSMFGMHVDLQTFMTEHHQINSRHDALNFISRLQQFEMKFKNMFIDLEYQKKHKIIPPVAIIDHTLNVLEDMTNNDPKENIFYQDFQSKIEKLELTKDDELKLLSQVEEIVKTIVIPNYLKFTFEIENIRKTADYKTGVWKLPKGDDYYQYCLKKHTTTNLTAEEIHQLGLQEVSRIQTEMRKRFTELGFTEGETFGEIEGKWWNSLKGNKYSFSSGEKGKQQALNHYLKILDETKEKLPDYFARIPATEVTVKRVPTHKEKFTGAHYQRAPSDNSGIAAFYANLNWIPKKSGMATLLYHETIPGHHLQIAYATEFCHSPMYRNFTFFTGFIEGWALYAEKLTFEEGWHKDIHSELGYLASELHRAVRLVVDTGIHVRKWSRSEAYKYMQDNLGWASYGEINRYTVWPGQACAYKIGELKILELRQKTRDQLGNDFNLKEFHEVVLSNGSIPLSVLEEVVDDWLESKK
ncbi:MAG: DUF885 domain-containing protein [Candidatus Cloacimonetes bacterium]|nr:DUF885 domain-containing protein [Candidatus Cloacimonadota bacterium]MCF7814140.1 DUF885 domain-containing protein [Candidatus Cloacimonadota bacterium]MCF7868711.1 DUF885 domain-containing protein [Candidatus Cloacimonadota bacterium]MCF7884139.1 DUF885 domain-containing protein [Candidatus Cloacimonadota bacterium]